MNDFGLSTQYFLRNKLGDIKQDLAVAIISQFGGEDEIMHEYVMALPESIDLKQVAAFNNTKALTGLYNTHKKSIIDFGWKYADRKGFSTPVALYGSIEGLRSLSHTQISQAMHDQDNTYHSMVASEIFRFSTEKLCHAWAAFTKEQDDFGEQLFNARHS